MKLSIALLIALSLVVLVCAGDRYESEVEVEDEDEDRRGRPDRDRSHRLKTEIDGDSGKIRFYGTGANFNESVRIEFKDLKERTADGNEADGDPDHEVDDFEGVQFTFDTETSTLFQGLNVSKISFHANDLVEAGDGSELLIEIFTFRENGIIQVDGVDTAVQVGTVKWNVAINSWPFCNASVTDGSVRDCEGDEGAFLDFIIQIGSEHEHEDDDGNREQEYAKEISDSEDEPRNRRYRLGASDSTLSADPVNLGPELILSSKVTVDGQLVDQPDGYPKVEGDLREQKFVFRFPRGESLYYDPVLSLSGSSSSAVSVAANALLVLFATLFATVALRS